MFRIRCDICGKWSIFSVDKIQHYKDGVYIKNPNIDRIWDIKGYDICTSCLWLDKRINARKYELEKRREAIIIPKIEAWVANRPILPDEFSKEDLHIDPPNYENFGAYGDRTYCQKLSKEEAFAVAKRYNTRNFKSPEKINILFFQRHISYELHDPYWVDTVGKLFRLANDTFVLRWKSGSRGIYDDD